MVTLAEGPWSARTSYEILTAVYHNGDGYISKRDNIGVEPGTDDSVWYRIVRQGQIPDIKFDEQGNMYADDVLVTTAFADVIQRSKEAVEHVEEWAELGESMAEAENQRRAKEDERIADEAVRVLNEKNRQTAEANRTRNEASREENERNRVLEESERETRFEEAMRQAASTMRKGDRGYSAYEVAVLEEGFVGSKAAWLASLVGPAGDSAYAIAVQQGYAGTKDQWLASLIGPQGKSAYQVAVDNGFEGTISEWLLSLKGAKGDPGKDITSIEQTSSSSESEGSNVITVTLSDGTTKTFTVKNGKRGLQGVPGVANAKYKQVAALPTASAATMDFIYLVESATAGVYNMSYTEEDAGAYSWKSLGTTAIQLADYATKQEVSQKADLIQTDIDPLQQTIRTYAILETGLYGSNVTYRHIIIPVYFQQVSFRANANNVCRYAWLASNAEPVAGGQIPLVSGTSVMEIPASQFDSVVVPDGAEYLAVYIGAVSTGYPFKPTEIKIGSIVIDSLDSDSIKNALSARQGKILRGYCLEGQTVDLSVLSEGRGRIYNGLWNNTARYRHVVFPVSEFSFLKITANPGYNATFAFLTSYATPVNGESANLVPDTSPIDILLGETVNVQVPKGANFVYLYSWDANYGTSHKGEYLPSNVYNFTTFRTALDLAEKNETSIDSIANRVNVKASFIGADTTQVQTQPIYDFASGQTYRCVILNPNVPLADTSGANYRFQLRAYDANGETVETIVRYTTNKSLPEFVDFVVPDGTAYICVLGRCVAGVEFPVIFFPVGGETIGTGDILSLNPKSEFLPKFLSAKKRYYTSTDNTRPNPLIVLHISDIHGNWDNVSRFIQFAGNYSDYVDELVNTGDTVLGLYTDGIAGYLTIPGVSSIINVIGNHDTREGNDWQSHIGVDAYNLLIKPFVSGWGVTQPTGAEENGYCYFYKDYTAKNVRMVFVDIMSYDATQDSWLSAVLSDARTSGYHIVIFTHFSGARNSSERNEKVFEKVPCNYTTLYSLGTDSTQLSGYNTNAYMMNDTVNDFIVAGGHFVGFVQGHYHADFVSKVSKYPNQLIFSIGATKAGEMRDFNHIVGTRDQDEFQIISIDPVNTIVKLYKVGANYDRYGRKKGSVCVDYTTGQVLGEGW